eukprot:TRINITY_DN4503_c0_g1_i1.p1 TRINITY_DN4503_c0_g1~~TRINITY_DN4503_c0_g1_i1.p1  ORF type:complete len:185 (-),score=82.79 TRINITY_DN4503_c0_g1_i1:47-601(-)
MSAEGQAPPPPVAPTVISLGDIATMKQTLDDSFSKILFKKGYHENQFYSNLKIVLGSTASLLALYAYVGPFDLPDNKVHEKTILFFICLSFFILSGTMQLATTFFEKVSFYNRRGLVFDIKSEMPQFQETYTINAIIRKANRRQINEKMSHSATRWFDSTGAFHEEEYEKDVTKLIKRIEEKSN